VKNFLLRWWQPLYVILASTWLFAPAVNGVLLHRLTLISEYEVPDQTFSYIFRLGDLLASLLLLAIVMLLQRKNKAPFDWFYWLFIIIALGSMIDATMTDSCRVVSHICIDQKTDTFFVHAGETVITSGAIALAAVLDWWKRRTIPSQLFVLLQIGMGIGALLSVGRDHQALLQFGYQFISVVWIAWFVQSYWGVAPSFNETAKRTVRTIAAIWAAVNGVASILLSFAHLHQQRLLDHLYFGSNTPWLSQHGILVGLVLLYISRHLYRGELRARQIFLVIISIEICKYAVINPSPLILSLYLGSFVVIFAAPLAFTRRSVALTFHTRLIDFLCIICGVLVAGILGTTALHHSPTGQTTLHHIHNHYVTARQHVSSGHYEEITDNRRLTLVAETLLAGTVIVGTISLFQPRKLKPGPQHVDAAKKARDLLEQSAVSSEDYFKVWPTDKQYFWTPEDGGFVAYKVVRSVAFALADPVAKDDVARAKVLQAFIAFCHESGWRACFLLVSETSREMYDVNGLNILEIGSSALVDIGQFTDTTVKNKWWRWQTNKNDKAGYSFDVSQPPHQPALLKELEAVSAAWLKRPGHREQSFAMGYFDIDYLQNSQICYLKQDGQIVAFTNLLPNLRPLPTATIDLMRFNPAHHGVMAYLLSKTIEHISQTDASVQFFDLGFVPFAKSNTALARIVNVLGKARFSATGLTQFKNKFEPQWQQNYIAYDGDLLDSGHIAINLEEALKK